MRNGCWKRLREWNRRWCLSDREHCSGMRGSGAVDNAVDSAHIGLRLLLERALAEPCSSATPKDFGKPFYVYRSPPFIAALI